MTTIPESPQRQSIRRLALDVGFSLATIALTIVFDFVQEAITDLDHLKAQMKQHSERVFAVQFDLLLVSLTILFGAYVSTRKEDRGNLVPPLFLSFFFVLGMLALAVASKVWGWDGAWPTLWAPDLLGLISIVVAVSAARSVP
jgi:lipopolysaccharide export LptBFGC system permease protein LptF